MKDKKIQITKAEENENQPLEDRALKAAAQLMGRELLPLLGIKGTVKRIAPTEQVFLEIKDFLADFNFEMEDGTWKHLEFESDSIKRDDLRRFRALEALISYHYKVEVTTCVLCSSNVKKLKKQLTQGLNIYRIQVIRLKDKKAETVIHKLEKKQQTGKLLERQEMLELLLSPLMSGHMAQKERIKRSLELLKQQPLERDEMVPMQSVLYTLAAKFLEQSELQQIREVLNMTILGQMLTEDARAKGMAEGKAEGMAELILELIGDFGNIPNTLRERIMSERDLDKLHLWHRQAAKSTSMDEFLKTWQAE